jgi:hypothetical protein
VSGLFIIVGTTVGSVMAAALGIAPFAMITSVFAAVAASLGALIVALSVLLYFRPQFHVAWGVLIIAFATGSVTSAFVGFAGLGLGIIGMLLGIVGGGLAIGWPSAFSKTAVPPPWMPYQLCLRCGRPGPVGFNFCAFCGAPAPAAGPQAGGQPPR